VRPATCCCTLPSARFDACFYTGLRPVAHRSASGRAQACDQSRQWPWRKLRRLCFAVCAHLVEACDLLLPAALCTFRRLLLHRPPPSRAQVCAQSRTGLRLASHRPATSRAQACAQSRAGLSPVTSLRPVARSSAPSHAQACAQSRAGLCPRSPSPSQPSSPACQWAPALPACPAGASGSHALFLSALPARRTLTRSKHPPWGSNPRPQG
jgi:hypothetical protein